MYLGTCPKVLSIISWRSRLLVWPADKILHAGLVIIQRMIFFYQSSYQSCNLKNLFYRCQRRNIVATQKLVFSHNPTYPKQHCLKIDTHSLPFIHCFPFATRPKMFAARPLARSASCAVSRIARPATIARPSSALLRALPARSAHQISGFSTSLLRKAAADNVDRELSQKLKGEIQFENEMKEGESLPVSIKDFLENGPFEVHDTPGMQHVQLTRTYGKEK